MSDLSIVICGAAGQGVQTVEEFLVANLKMSGYNVYATKEYMSRVRGGINSTELRISSSRVASFVSKIDILIPLKKEAIPHLSHRIDENTHIIGESETIANDQIEGNERIFNVEFSEIAKEIGNKIYSNVVSVGTIAGLLDADVEYAEEFIKERFNDKGQKIVENNITAYNQGYEKGKYLRDKGVVQDELAKNKTVRDEILFNGNQAIALGAIAGGCNFISAYPMSPSTGVLIFLAQHSHDFGIVVDQAESEIAAINKNIGAWYTGARAIASTSGGGFALMEEGLSLAGMIESPLVVHIAQRPGPATGLPTRTGQEDLNLALYAGHGEFPRIIYAPGTIEEAFYLTQNAFNLADKLQIPIIILTDQYFVDSYYNIPNLDLSDVSNTNQFIKSDENYKRYTLTDSGISPRGIPTYGSGLIRVDSDEHDERGQITEDVHHMRIEMIKKRLFKKEKLIHESAVEPTLRGRGDYKYLVICWGSNYHVVSEALENLGRNDIAMLHYSQVFPLHNKTNELLQKADTVFTLENNATGQFTNILKLYGNINIRDENRILKFNGEPFAVEEVQHKIIEKIEQTKGGA